MAPMNPTAPIVWRNLIRRRKALQRYVHQQNNFYRSRTTLGNGTSRFWPQMSATPKKFEMLGVAAALDRAAIQTALAIFSVLGRPPALHDEKSKILG